jgi:hypothetical protein
MATKNANALRAAITLKNNESGHHWIHSTIPCVPCTASIHKTLPNIQVDPKNKKAQYIIYIKDFSEVLTFSESDHCISRFIHAITR